jgi:hypothetical protein
MGLRSTNSAARPCPCSKLRQNRDLMAVILSVYAARSAWRRRVINLTSRPTFASCQRHQAGDELDPESLRTPYPSIPAPSALQALGVGRQHRCMEEPCRTDISLSSARWISGWGADSALRCRTRTGSAGAVGAHRAVRRLPWPGGRVTTVFDETDGTTTMTVTVLAASKEIRDAVVSSGIEHGAAESYDRLAGLLGGGGGRRQIDRFSHSGGAL